MPSRLHLRVLPVLAPMFLVAVIICSCGDDTVSDPCYWHGHDYDRDGVCDDEDLCPGYDDSEDRDRDGIPDGCDPCPDGQPDSDADGVCDASDICPGADDRIDADEDQTPDCVDPCIPPDCPAPGELENGDFEAGISGWTHQCTDPYDDDCVEPGVVADGTDMVLRLGPVVCGEHTESTADLFIPTPTSGGQWSLRFDYQLLGPVEGSFCRPLTIRVSQPDKQLNWYFGEETSQWTNTSLCLSGVQTGALATIELGLSFGGGLNFCGCDGIEALFDDVALVLNASDCLPHGWY